MAIAFDSPRNLKNRRQELLSQRRWQAVQKLWRFLSISAMAGGLCWVMATPSWEIKEDKQVEIKGNQLMSVEKIRTLLSLSYPQSLWQLEAHQLETNLETLPPIADAVVTRQIFPTTLTVQVQERQPVAVAFSSQGVGFLDEGGIFIPENFYSQQSSHLKQLPLKITGYETQYQSYWKELYPLIRYSPIKISEVDWRNPSNIVLKTELGMVHCGAYTSEFSEKIKVLAKMKKLTSKVPSNRIVYIDITNPQAPTVKLKPEPVKSPQKSSQESRP
ncbi:Polypeptide-transport-associated domain protein FtsQ-type [Gloeothece citriformis PCC 7424]|uniref:Polypeptide-transport-associated domain protein FtsQ-type n=1 Tax=Gloeothece citriformis (strain PCC 7424) TaxID=65393 RepID=B7KFQ2_GLOC7|nr:FtsQ-type POTRA domain-containing protein [Gloeothece citriformis]ACK73377.1 Polypeptide-transport-associated domain protein FtsQ-type [Gloeothece citriformis PCC 7424]